MKNKRIEKQLTKVVAPRPDQEIKKENKPVRKSKEPIKCKKCGSTPRRDNLNDKGESGLCNKCQKNLSEGITGRDSLGKATFNCKECGEPQRLDKRKSKDQVTLCNTHYEA